MPAHRAPSPIPDSSLTTNTSTGPSRALVPELQVSVARPRPCSATTAKSLTVQPGLIGQGRYVGKSPAAASASTNPSYDASSGRSSGCGRPVVGARPAAAGVVRDRVWGSAGTPPGAAR